jgi:hypothetical protein
MTKVGFFSGRKLPKFYDENKIIFFNNLDLRFVCYQIIFKTKSLKNFIYTKFLSDSVCDLKISAKNYSFHHSESLLAIYSNYKRFEFELI